MLQRIYFVCVCMRRLRSKISPWLAANIYDSREQSYSLRVGIIQNYVFLRWLCVTDSKAVNFPLYILSAFLSLSNDIFVDNLLHESAVFARLKVSEVRWRLVYSILHVECTCCWRVNICFNDNYTTMICILYLTKYGLLALMLKQRVSLLCLLWCELYR